MNNRNDCVPVKSELLHFVTHRELQSDQLFDVHVKKVLVIRKTAHALYFIRSYLSTKRVKLCSNNSGTV